MYEVYFKILLSKENIENSQRSYESLK